MVSLKFIFLESSIEMVVLRRRQVACIRMGLFTFLIGAGLVFVYHYVDNNDYQKQMEDAISILERDTSEYFFKMSFRFKFLFLENGLAAINDLEKHLEDIDIQPKPEAQYVVYNRVPKVSKRFQSLYHVMISNILVWFHVNDDTML